MNSLIQPHNAPVDEEPAFIFLLMDGPSQKHDGITVEALGEAVDCEIIVSEHQLGLCIFFQTVGVIRLLSLRTFCSSITEFNGKYQVLYGSDEVFQSAVEYPSVEIQISKNNI